MCNTGGPIGCVDCIPGYAYDPVEGCKEIICSKQEYLDISAGQCIPCYAACDECTGPTNTDCVMCDSTTSVEHNGTCELCEVIHVGFKSPLVDDACDEHCGDGFNIGVYECDDGNTENGDGCSD